MSDRATENHPTDKPSRFEAFWLHDRYAVVGQAAGGPFPKLSYAALKRQGKTVYPVCAGGGAVDGDPAFESLFALPGPVDAIIIEVPRAETVEWVRQAAEKGIPRVWIHDGRDTPEALALAEERGMEALHGTCAVMYLTPGFSVHAIHRFFRKLTGNY